MSRGDAVAEQHLDLELRAVRDQRSAALGEHRAQLCRRGAGHHRRPAAPPPRRRSRAPGSGCRGGEGGRAHSARRCAWRSRGPRPSCRAAPPGPPDRRASSPWSASVSKSMAHGPGSARIAWTAAMAAAPSRYGPSLAIYALRARGQFISFVVTSRAIYASGVRVDAAVSLGILDRGTHRGTGDTLRLLPPVGGQIVVTEQVRLERGEPLVGQEHARNGDLGPAPQVEYRASSPPSPGATGRLSRRP